MESIGKMSAESITILNNFFGYADRIGLELLEGDKRYLRYLSMGIQEERLRKALVAYIANWQEGMNKTSDEIRKQGEGRRTANNKIRDALM